MKDAVLNSQDIVELTAGLVDVPSVSGNEQALADLIEIRLRNRAPKLKIYRIGDNVVARTERGAGQNLALAGHIDTVPPVGPTGAKADADRVMGRGAVDMKGGLAVMLLLAEEAPDSALDCTFIFYEKEELGSHQSGLHKLMSDHPDLVSADSAVVLEPTHCMLEAGCQGNLLVELRFEGETAHSARPWQGRNAIHGAAPALLRLSEFTPEPAEVGGLVFPQAFSVVAINGGRQGNMLPDHCTVVVNYRHAPCVSTADATETVRRLVPDAAELRVTLQSPPAGPSLGDPLILRLRDLSDLTVRPKLGWTDVARFAQHGIPAVNFGPGDPELAHTPCEVIFRADLERCHQALSGLLVSGDSPEREPHAQSGERGASGHRARAGTVSAHPDTTRSSAPGMPWPATAPVDGPLTRSYLQEFGIRAPSCEEIIKPAQESEHLRVAFGDRYLTRPALLEAERARGLEADLSRLFAMLASLPRRSFAGDLAAMGRAAGMTQVQIDAVRRTTAGHPIQLGRADLYQQASDFQLLEFNIGSPLGGFDNAVLNRALLRQPFLADFVAAAGLQYIDTLARIAEVIKQECEDVHDGSTPVVALVDTPPNYAQLEQRLYFVAKIWTGMGLDAVACPLDQLEERSGRLFIGRRAINVVYRFFLIEDLLDADSLRLIEPVLRAAEHNKVALVSRMDAELYGNKGMLALLSDDASRGAFSAEETIFIERFLPWSRSLRSGKSTVNGEDVDLLEYARASQRDLVLKPTLMHGGIGVVPGWTVDAQTWEECLRTSADGPYVLQRRVRPVTESFPCPGEPGATEPLALNWGVFLIQDRYGGTIVRGSADPEVGIVSMANGARVGCCFHEPFQATTGRGGRGR